MQHRETLRRARRNGGTISAGKPIRTFGKGRVCSNGDCTTKLAADNPADICSPCNNKLHSPPPTPLVRADGPSDVDELLVETLHSAGVTTLRGRRL